MTFRMPRRQFLMGSSALAAAGAMGLRPAVAQDQALRLIWWGGQARADRTLAVADAYAAATGTTPAEGEFLSWNDYWPKLATQVAGGTAPDILQMDYRFIVEYATRNAIAPMDEFLGGALKLDDFDTDQIEGGKVDGKLYGISLGANSVAMLVNATAFEEAGVEVPGMDWTYDTLREIGEAFKSANIRGGLKGMSDGSGSEPMLDNWSRQRGKTLYTADGKLGPNVDDMVEWFTMWNEFRDAGYITSAEDTALDTGAAEVSMVALNKSAMIPSNSNQLVIHQSINPDKLTITSYPRIALPQAEPVLVDLGFQPEQGSGCRIPQLLRQRRRSRQDPGCRTRHSLLGFGARGCRPDAQRAGSDLAQLRGQSRRSGRAAARLPAECRRRNRHLAAARAEPGSRLRWPFRGRCRSVLRRRSDRHS